MGGYIGSDYADGGYAADDSGYAGSNYQDDTGYAADDSGYAGSQYNETLENATAGTTHTMLATGNPILILLAVIAVLGGYAAFKRK